MEQPTTLKAFPLGTTQNQNQHWARKYRTVIAASSSSVLSTCIAVSYKQLMDNIVGRH